MRVFVAGAGGAIGRRLVPQLVAARPRGGRIDDEGDGAGIWSWIHLDDAASATVAAVERGRRRRFNVVDDEPAPVSLLHRWASGGSGGGR